MATPTPQNEEVARLDKLLFSLVMANEAHVEALIATHLPSLLDKLSTTTDDAARNKIVECCSHLLKRIRADSKVQVPCAVLLAKARAPEAGAFTRNFSIVFLEIGCPRLPPAAKGQLGQALLVGLAEAGDGPYGRQSAALVHRLLEVLEFIKPPTPAAALGGGGSETPATGTAATESTASPSHPPLPPAGPPPSARDLAFVLELFFDILLVPNASRLVKPVPGAPLAGPIQGLSHDALQRLASHPSLWASTSGNPQATLGKLKLDVLRLLHSSLFTYSASLPLLLIATTDSETRVKERAESLVKMQTDSRATNTASLPPPRKAAEDKRLADRILRLFLGGTDSLSSDKATRSQQQPRSVLAEAARIKLLDWAMQECPEALVEETALCLKASLQSLTSRDESTAIRALGARLAAFVAMRCPPGPFALAGPLLLAATKKVMVGCYQALLLSRSSSSGGLPSRGGALDREAVLREGCYETLAALAHRMGGSIVLGGQQPKAAQPQLLFSDPMLLRLLFEALASEGPVQAIKVAEALGALRTAYLPAQAALGRAPVDMSQLCPLLCQSALNDEARARLAAVEWAVTALAPSDILPRSLCLHLMDDPVLAVRKAALAGLGVPFLPVVPGAEEDLPVYPECDDVVLPMEASTVAAIPPFPTLTAALLSTDKGPGKFPLVGMDVKGKARSLHFLWLSFLATAAVPPASFSFSSSPDYPPIVLDALNKLVAWLRTQGLGDPIHAKQGPRRLLLYRSAASCLACLARVLPSAALEALATMEMEFPWLQGWLSHEDAELGESMAKLMGRLAPFMPTQKRTTALYALAAMVDKAAERRDPRAGRGALLTIGHMVQAMADKKSSEMETVTFVATSSVARAARHALNEMHAAACLSLGLMGSVAPLPLLPLPGGASTTTPPGAQSVEEVVQGLLKDIKESGGGTPKERRGEAAAGCLAALAKGAKAQLPLCTEAQEACLGMGMVRDDELHFAIGQALASLALASEAHFTHVWTKITEETVKNNSPHIRAASTLWLLVLLAETAKQERGLTSTLLPFARLHKAQEVLVKLLRDKSELGQEASGKALGIVYDVATKVHGSATAAANARDVPELVDALVLLLRGPKAVAQPTQLELNVPSGVPIQTSVDIGTNNPFRELCTMATDLGQPQLMYHFLALPSTHTSWAGRRASLYAGTSALGSAQELQEALAPLLPKLVPRLYRARFDPTMAVRQAMEPLWKTVAPEGAKATVKQYLPAILEELCGAAGSRKWRERQSAVAGLADLLPGRTYAEIGRLIEKLWVIAFRALDDLKESVQLAGLDLAKSLSQLSARLTNREETPAADVQEVVRVLLPLILTQGLPSKAKEVQAVAVFTLVRLVKGAGECIRPYLADLMSALIEAQSAIEPAQLQYLQFHATSMSMTEEAMEQLRYGLSRSGPLQEALDHCLKELDGPSLTQLMPRLLGHLRSGVGLNTRCCAANVVVVLATRFRPEVKPHVPALLRVLAAGSLAERSATAQGFFLGALASIAKLAHEFDVRKIILRLCREYRQAADLAVYRGRRLPIVSALRQLVGAAAESLEGQAWATVLPLAYLGRHDEEEAVRKAWEDIWVDGCAAYGRGGNTARALASELCSGVEVALASSSWLSRRGALLALADLTDTLGAASLNPHAYKLVHDLLLLLPGRLWDGKENVLMALVKIVVKCPEMVDVAAPASWLFSINGVTSFPPGLLRAGDEDVEEDEAAGQASMVVEAPAETEAPATEASEAGAEPEQRDEEAFSRLVNEDDSAAMDVVVGSIGDDTATSSSSGDKKLSYRGLVRVLVEQCSRSHRDYRRSAVQCLMDLSLAFPAVDVLGMAQETLIKMAGGLELDSTQGGEGVDHVLRAWAVEALAALFPPLSDEDSYTTQKDALVWLLPMLLSRATFAIWSLRRAVYKSLRRVMERLYVRPDPGPSTTTTYPSLLTGAVADKVVAACLKGVEDAKYHQVREAAIDVLLALIKRTEVEARVAIVPQSERMGSGLDRVLKDSQPGVVRLAMEAKALLHNMS